MDTCHSGQGARLDWHRAGTKETKAWVIGAAHELAYEGWFTEATTTVLRRIASGDIDLYPSEYIPFNALVEQIRTEVARLGGQLQHVMGTPVDGEPVVPFLANPRRPSAGSLLQVLPHVDATVAPFSDLDIALDPAHFLDRAAGHRELAADSGSWGCFAGRQQELATLTTWLDDTEGGTAVVTGGAGSGKSALIGVMVCALHPVLRDATRKLWGHTRASGPWRGPLAAVHLRERGLDDVVAGLVRQLTLPAEIEQSGPAALVEAIAAFPERPLLIFDALDEARDQDAVLHRLILELANARRSDGSPAAWLMIGTRPWQQFEELIEHGRTLGKLIDLDDPKTVSLDQLQTALKTYIFDLLNIVMRSRASAHPDHLRRLSATVADALTDGGHARGGEFLTAGLFTQWLVRAYAEILADDDVLSDLQVPRTVAELLDLDLETRPDPLWARAVLTALAYAEGAGMPATLIRQIAPIFHPAASADMTPGEFDDVLEQVRFYLRSSPDVDGSTLYRLFHQSLVDRLRDNDLSLTGVVGRLIQAVPLNELGAPRWEGAEPYLRRHGVQHVADAGRLDLLCYEDPESLGEVLNRAGRTPQGRLAAAIYRTSSTHCRFHDLENRQQLLALDTARFRASAITSPSLGRQRSASRLIPHWSTGGEVSGALRAIIAGHTGAVYALAVAELEGRPVVVSGGGDGMVRSWDLATGAPAGKPLTGHTGRVWAVSGAELKGRPVVVSGGGDGMVRSWDLATGAPAGNPLTGHTGRVWAVSGAELKGRPVVVSGGWDGLVRVWDLATGAPTENPLPGHDSGVQAVAVAELEGRPVVVSGGQDGLIRVWDLATGAPIGNPLTAHDSGVNALTVAELEGCPIIVSGGWDGLVRVWDLATGALAKNPLTGHTSGVQSVAVAELEGRPVVVAGGRDGTVRVWDLASGAPAGNPLTGHTGPVYAVAVAELEGRPVIVSGGGDGLIRVWDLATGAPAGNPLTGHTGPVNAVAVAELEGRPVIVSGGGDGLIRVWDLATGAPAGNPLTGHTGPVNAVAVAELEGRPVIVSGGRDGTVRVWDLASGAPARDSLTGHDSGVQSVALAELEGRPVVVSGGWDGLVRVWDLATGAPARKPLTGHTSGVQSVAVADLKGRPAVVSGGADGTVRVQDLATGAPAGNPATAHTGHVWAVAVAELEGRPVVVSGGGEGTVWVWPPNRRAGRLLAPMVLTSGHLRTIATASSSTGTILSYGDQEGFIVCVNMRTRRQICVGLAPGGIRSLTMKDRWVIAAFGSEVACFEVDVPG